MADNFISGTVNLGDDPIEGATVKAVEQDSSFTAYETTDVNGEYNFDATQLETGINYYHIVARWEDSEGNYYRSKSIPWIEADGESIIEDFEQYGSLSDVFSGDLGTFSITTDSAVGDQALEATSGSSTNDRMWAREGDLPFVPKQGDRLSWLHRPNDSAGSYLCVFNENSFNGDVQDGVMFDINGGDGVMRIMDFVNGDYNGDLATGSWSEDLSNYYWEEVELHDDGTAVHTSYHFDEVNNERGSEIQSISVTAPNLDGGGILGFRHGWAGARNPNHDHVVLQERGI